MLSLQTVQFQGGPRDGAKGEVRADARVVAFGEHDASDAADYFNYRRTLERAEGLPVFVYAGHERHRLPHDPLWRRGLVWLGLAQKGLTVIPA